MREEGRDQGIVKLIVYRVKRLDVTLIARWDEKRLIVCFEKN